MKSLLLPSIALPLLLGAAQAASIGINFGAGRAGASLDPTTSAGAVPQTNWNNAAGASGGPLALNDDAGAASGASVTWATDEEWSDGSPTDGNGQLLLGWISENGDPGSTVSITGIPYPEYSLYVYMHHDRTNEDTIFGEVGGAFPDFTLIETDLDNGVDETLSSVTLVQQTTSGAGEGNYAVFSGLTAANLDLTMSVGIGQRAPINGIQIVAIPEPSGAALLGLAGLTLLLRRRR